MKKINNISLLSVILLVCSCANLDLNPLSEPSSDTWYKTPQEVRISLNDFYRSAWYGMESGFWTDRHTDDYSQRTNIYAIPANSLSADDSGIKEYWSYTYKNISRANRVIAAVEKLRSANSADDMSRYVAEACFFRAYSYSKLITLWGDVPFYLTDITPEEAMKMGRTPKADILKQIYADFDYAAEVLPAENTDSNLRLVDKGCAYAFKARIALYQADYETAKTAAESCIRMGQYSLCPDYGELFRDLTKNDEVIFEIAHSNQLELNSEGTPTTQSIGSFFPRTAGGTHNAQPSWELLAVYEMTNGKTIDDPESGFDCHDPFANRDPRCCYTFAAPKTEILQIIWDPTPSALEVLDVKSGKMVTNKDCKGGTDCKNAAYNGCCLRKGARDAWRTDLHNDNPIILMRYADVLLMYAEAQIELGNTTDPQVLNYINDIRARAYKVDRAQIDKYPSIRTTDQTALRKILRRERRVEFAWEGRRYFDLQRWHQFKNAFSNNMYGFSRTPSVNTAAEKAGNWFWPDTPEFDEDGFPQFKKMYDTYKPFITQHGVRVYDDDDHIYLWPIPSADIVTMQGALTQNTGY